MSQTFNACERCGARLNAAESEVIIAAKLLDATAHDGKDEVESFRVLFHPACWGDGLAGYKRVSA